MAHRGFEPPNKKVPNPPVIGGRRHSENKSNLSNCPYQSKAKTGFKRLNSHNLALDWPNSTI